MWKKKFIQLFIVVFVICILPPLQAEEIENGSFEYIKNEEECKVTNIFIEMDLRQALNEISTQCKVPILIDDSVYGYIAMLEADEMPLEECLTLLLKPGGFFFEKIENYYIVASPDPSSPLFSQIATTERIRPRHLKAKDIFQLIPKPHSDYIKVDNITNSLIITALPNAIDKIKAHIAQIDLAPPQVMIEALITEVSATGSKKLGVDWYLKFKGEKEDLRSGSVDVMDLTATLEYVDPARTLQKVMTTLKLLVEEGEATIKANPKIIALNGETANINIGKEQYYIIQAPLGTYTYSRFESIATGIKLNIIPYVYESGEITVTIEPEVSDVLSEGVDGSPIISKRTAKTTVTVMDGQPIIIGGLQMSTESKAKSGFPCIGDIPLLGLLFQTRRKNILQNEVIIIITPHIYNLEEINEPVYQQRRPGYKLK